MRVVPISKFFQMAGADLRDETEVIQITSNDRTIGQFTSREILEQPPTRDPELVLLETILQTIEAGDVASSNLGDSYTITVAADQVREWRRLAGLEG